MSRSIDTEQRASRGIARTLVLVLVGALGACSPAPAPAELRAFTLPVDGMTCSACEDNIRLAVMRVPGVHSCKPDFAAHRAEVVIDARASEEVVAAAIRGLGYEVPESKAGPDAGPDAGSGRGPGRAPAH
jgi:copper chaperone CopZ